MTKRDIIIAALFLFVALGAGLYNFYSSSASAVSKRYLNIIYKNEIIKKVKLPASKKIEIDAGGGGWTVEIKGFKARISAADCPGRDCVKKGWISNKAEALICVPQNYLVEFEGKDKEWGDKTDAVTQ
ncbi:MAG: NusG domain II-containing protein [Elusimicrobia bacterium]|jgi:hypothetical protein|nr:NusG domain II-containing protein [Elusimicrobiota bacterium]